METVTAGKRQEDGSVRTDEILVEAPARLHLGFLDVGGTLGRRFGSVGVAITRPGLRVRFQRSANPYATGEQSNRARGYLLQCLELLELQHAAAIDVETAIPAHAGLGSGTQLALAVVAGLSRLYDLDEDTGLAAVKLSRGRRSGIGLATFEQGGLIVDGGHGTHSVAPPVITRMVFPSAWRVVLVMDPQAEGLSGSREVQAFNELEPMSATVSGDICRNVLLRVLPGLREGDFESFAAGIDVVQNRVGEYFAPQQGGLPFTSSRVAAVAEWARAEGYRGIGQSSWGPTGFIFCPDVDIAEHLAEAMATRWGGTDGLEVCVTAVANEGASVTDVAPSSTQPATRIT